MKNSFRNIVKSLAFAALCCGPIAPLFGQLFKYTLTQTGSTVCVKSVPQFTDATACYHGGNAVLITPTTVSIESGDITNGLGSWSIVSNATFMGINFFQFGSETLSANQSFTSGTPVTLFCVAIDQGECTSGEVRLMLQANHNTPAGTDPDLSIYNLGVRHTVTASNANNCSPENGTVFDGLTGTTSYSCSLLPVELVSFEANAVVNAVELNWKSASETNFDGYELQRSTNGRDFSKIALVSGVGGTSPTDYRHLDEDALPNQLYYYRLKMLDLDGSFEHSPVRTAKIEGQTRADLTIKPNPAKGHFFIDFETSHPGAAMLELVGEQGQTVLRQHYQLGEGENSLMVGTGRFAAGSYVVRLQTVDGAKSGKVVITGN